MKKNINNVSTYKLVRLINILLICCLILISKTLQSSPIDSEKDIQLASIEDQMLAYYPLDGDAIDASGNGNDGVINGALAGENFRGIADSSLAFDGVDDDVTLPSIGVWGTNLTLSFWVYANSAGQNQPHILIGSRDYGNSATLVNFYVSLRESGTMRWTIASNGINSDLETEKNFPLDRWVHVVTDWSSDTDKMNVFWDGKLMASSAIGETPRYLNSDIGIGHFCNGCSSGANYFNGLVDDFRIHSRLLELAEISSIAGVNAEYPMDGNAVDISGNERNGTEYGVTPAIGVFGEENSAFEFDGVDDLIDLPAFGNWGQEIAFSMWFKAHSDSSDVSHVFIGSRNEGTGSTLSDFVLSMKADASIFWKIYSGGANSFLVTETGVFEYDKWNHIAADWSRITNTMRVFINGELIGSSTTGANPRYLNNSVGLGNYNIDYDSTRAPFHGQIDQVKIFNRVLTEKEVLSMADVIFKNQFED